MAEQVNNPSETKSANVPLRSVNDLAEAHEWLFNSLRDGTIEPSRAATMTKVLKGSTYLKTELPLRVASLMLKAQGKNLNLPDKLLAGFTQD